MLLELKVVPFWHVMQPAALQVRQLLLHAVHPVEFPPKEKVLLGQAWQALLDKKKLLLQDEQMVPLQRLHPLGQLVQTACPPCEVWFPGHNVQLPFANP